MIYLRCKYDIISVPVIREAYITREADIISKIYHPFREERISLKKPLLSVDKSGFFLGAGGGGRTRTLSPGLDFESSTSAYSITPAEHLLL